MGPGKHSLGFLAEWEWGQIGECSGEERRMRQTSSTPHVCPSGQPDLKAARTSKWNWYVVKSQFSWRNKVSLLVPSVQE